MAIDIAYCGLDCAACPAFHAVERLTVGERQAVADKWNGEFGGTHTLADIDCLGCTHEGRHAPYCSECEIRKCGAEKAVATCAECSDFNCARLSGFLANVPEARSNLEASRPS
ncbi:MAG TPA: DUF3795 domain-containing protein [Candidatus Limnocylindrales bacterium]